MKKNFPDWSSDCTSEVVGDLQYKLEIRMESLVELNQR